MPNTTDTTDTTAAPAATDLVNYATHPSSLHYDGLVDLVAALRVRTANVDVPDPVIEHGTDDQRVDEIVYAVLAALVGDLGSAGPFILSPRCAPTVDIADDDLMDGPSTPGPGSDHQAAFRTAVLARAQTVKDRGDHIVNKANDVVATIFDLIAEGYILRAAHEHTADGTTTLHLGPDIAPYLAKVWKDSYLDVPPHVMTALAILRERTATVAWARAKDWDPIDDAVNVGVFSTDHGRHIHLFDALAEIHRDGGAVDVAYTMLDPA